MVRLKALINLIQPYINLISIPYGAIKSYIDFINCCYITIISIPYGAIKRYFEKQYYLYSRHFNSLWCD